MSLGDELGRDGYGHLLTRQQVSEVFVISVRTLDRWVAQGSLKPVYPGGDKTHPRFRRDDVVRLVLGEDDD